MGRKIRNIIFDLGKVLVDFEPERCMETLGFSADAKKAFREKIFSSVWEECDRIPYGDEEIRKLFKSCVPGYEAEVDRFWDGPASITRVMPYTEEWLSDLKRQGFRIFILSNYGKRAFEINSGGYGFLRLADGSLISYEVQKVKPDPEIFRELCRRFDILPAESVFIDDRPENVKAGEKLGFTGIVFTGYEEAKRRLEELTNDS